MKNLQVDTFEQCCQFQSRHFLYVGEAAYLISMYFAERQLTCQRKTQLELICADGLGGNDREVAYVIATDKQTKIFLDEEEAKVSKS